MIRPRRFRTRLSACVPWVLIAGAMFCWMAHSPQGGAAPAPAAAFQGTRSDGPVESGISFTKRVLRQTVTAEQAAQGVEGITLANINGNLSLKGGDEPVIRIIAKKELTGSRKTTAEEAERYLRELQVELGQRGSVLEIKTISPRQPSGVNASINYEVLLPRETVTTATTVNGNIEIKDIGRTVAVRSTNGNISIREVGPLSVRTTNGNINVDGVAGPAEVTNINGNIACREVDGALIVRGMNGNSDVIQRRLLAAAQSIEIRRQNGRIHLALPKDQPFALDAACGTGSMAIDFPVKVEGKGVTKRAAGTVGTGGPRIQLSTQTGGIEIEAK